MMDPREAQSSTSKVLTQLDSATATPTQLPVTMQLAISLLTIRVHRMQALIANAMDCYQFIGEKSDGKLIVAHQDLQEQLKKLLIYLLASMNEISGQCILHKRTPNPLIASQCNMNWTTYKTECQTRISALRDNNQKLASPLPAHHLFMFNHILQSIEACFNSSSELTDEELKKALKDKLLQAALIKLKQTMPATKPTCFVSYSWGNHAHAHQVHEITQLLKIAGIDVKLDIWENAASSVPVFLSYISKVNFILLVCTTDLVEKWNNFTTEGQSRNRTGESYRGNVVAQEITLIQHRKTQKSSKESGIICSLLQGEHSKSVPDVLQDLASDAFDFRSPLHRHIPIFNVLSEMMKHNNQQLLPVIEKLLKELQRKNEFCDSLSGEKLREMNIELREPDEIDTDILADITADLSLVRSENIKPKVLSQPGALSPAYSLKPIPLVTPEYRAPNVIQDVTTLQNLVVNSVGAGNIIITHAQASGDINANNVNTDASPELVNALAGLVNAQRRP